MLFRENGDDYATLTLKMFLNQLEVLPLPSVLRLFQSVAQCCMGQKQAQQVMEGTGAS